MKYIKLKLSVIGFLITLFVFAANAQQIVVSGIVRDAVNGEPIIGVNILEKGTTHGTVTDFDGNFRFSVASDATLAISYIGYVSQEVAVNGRTSIVIELREDIDLLDELIVIGYGMVRRGDMTGSVTAIRPDETNRGLVTNAQDLLLGRVAGMQVTTDGGAPGAGATIRIRGGSSLNASNDPLIVIDGFPMDNEGIQGVSNPLSMINPADIETFTILRDASATAIYGSRASNGVIIITTKRGSASAKPQVSYNGNVSAGIMTNRLEVMDGNRYRNYIGERFPTLAGRLGDANTDWQDEIFRTAFGTDHNISVTGGARNMPYRVSAGYTNQNGILITSNMERFTGSASVSPNFLDNHLSFNVNARGMYIKNRFAQDGAVGGALAMDPTRPVRMPADEDFRFYDGYYQTPYNVNPGDSTWIRMTNTNTPQNPVAQLNLRDDRAKSSAFIGNIEGVYKVHGIEGLRLHANFGIDLSEGKQNTVYSPYSYSNNYFGRHITDQITKRNTAFNMFASYNRNLDIHAFDATGGYEWQHFHRTGTERSHGYYQSTFNNPALAGQIHNPEFHEWATESFLVSFFGRVNYRLLGRYLFTATLRADGSSRFAPGNQWGLFPSFAFAWNMHEEHFLQDVTWLSELKLRLGYGITGQQNIADNDYLGLIRYLRARDLAWYTLGERDPITGEHIYLPPLRPEPFNLLLTWESTTTYNVGLDFGLMRGRFTGSLDFYHRLTTNLLNEVEIPVMTNFRNMMMSNIGSLSNTGLELSLNAIAVHDRDLRWDIGLTAAWNTNKIESLTVGGAGFRETGGVSAGTGNTIQRFQQGLPAYTFFVYETRVNEHGFWEIVNQDDNPAINMNDLIPFHNPMPDVMLGLTSQWQFRKFDFSFSLRANIGNYVYNDVKAARMSNLVNIEREGAFTNVLIGTLEPFTRIEHSPNIGLTTNAFMIDRFVENASFLRCDNITLGYTFNKGKINGRVFGTVQNPFVITGYTGIDPEITNDGIDNIIFPRALTTIIGVSLQF